MVRLRTAEDAFQTELIQQAIQRNILTITDSRITYRISSQKAYSWSDPEEWVRAWTIAWLVIDKGYPPNRIKTEVTVPRRTPNDFADIVIYADDQCRSPYLVVENKADGQNLQARGQGVEQVFGNANSLRAPYALYEEAGYSMFYDVQGYPPTERIENQLGARDRIPAQYGDIPQYLYVAGEANDIEPVDTPTLSSKIRRAHYIIWAGGRRDPLLAFDEWSKLLFAKVMDERTTPTGHIRRFQVGQRETSSSVSTRIHSLFQEAARTDPSIFPGEAQINLPDQKISSVVQVLQSISFTGTSIDSIGRAFEEFFGSIFRGELGQYFTMRELSRFTVAVLDITPSDFVLDPTVGSGGFLLEVLLQCWNKIDRDYSGQPVLARERLKTDFALSHVYGIEIHEILARICKINLLLHHDGHTNIESDRSCLDRTFANTRLNSGRSCFSVIVGNPPFGDEVRENDEDHLGQSQLSDFWISSGRARVDSEQVIIERCITFLEPGGRFGLILPDGVLNNQGSQSNCPRTRYLLARHGMIRAIVSLPDHAFKKSGAQNKTSIVFFQKWSAEQERALRIALDSISGLLAGNEIEDSPEMLYEAILNAELNYKVFLAEANHVGYTASGARSHHNDLYAVLPDGTLNPQDQDGTILGAYKDFEINPESYRGRLTPDCTSIDFDQLWIAHSSNRLDPKYHLFQREAQRQLPEGWVRQRIGHLMSRRTEPVGSFDPDHEYTVMTISQNGEIRPRQAGKGNNPPSWIGEYFETVSPGDWFAASTDDVVFSSIDLWKGCVAIVPEQFNGALVTKEFPIYEITDERLLPEFFQLLLRTRYYQRAFRAITTGHSNRRRTQVADFESVEIAFPSSAEEQKRLIQDILHSRLTVDAASTALKHELLKFSDLIDGRGQEENSELESDDEVEE